MLNSSSGFCDSTHYEDYVDYPLFNTYFIIVKVAPRGIFDAYYEYYLCPVTLNVSHCDWNYNNKFCFTEITPSFTAKEEWLISISEEELNSEAIQSVLRSNYINGGYYNFYYQGKDRLCNIFFVFGNPRGIYLAFKNITHEMIDKPKLYFSQCYNASNPHYIKKFYDMPFEKRFDYIVSLFLSDPNYILCKPIRKTKEKEDNNGG